MRNIVFITLIALLSKYINADGGGSGQRGQWQVINPDSNIPCVALNGQLDLSLSYIVKVSDAPVDAHLTVPKKSTVSSKSSCQMTNIINNNAIDSQMLQLDLYNMTGWSIQFYFTKDARFQTNNGKEWALYQIRVMANYTALPDLFPSPADATHEYINKVKLNGENIIADNLFANVDTSLYCPSKQLFMINDDPKVGPEATITFSLLQLQSYIQKRNYASSNIFGPKDVCITDQHQVDLVPIIVGSVLAGMIVCTMLAYLAYRACLPDEVIRLVNPNSHVNEAMSSDDEDEENSLSTATHSNPFHQKV